MRADVSRVSRIAVVAIAFIAFTASGVMAQGSLQSFGVKGGVTAATLTPSPSGTMTFTPGFVAGVFYTRSVNTFTWQLEGLIQQQGSGFGNAKFHLLYLTVPGLLRFNFRQHRSTYFYATAGGSIGFLIAGSLVQGGQSGDLSSLINRTTADVIVGAGFDIQRRYSIEVRWNEGLRKTGIVINNTDMRNRALSVSFGYSFRSTNR